jgi:hypothetical protein
MAADEQTLTEDQAAVYDRQLRVWGVDVQRRCDLSGAVVRPPQPVERRPT